MNQNIYALYDCKTAAYLDPFTSPNDAVAIRSLVSHCERNPQADLTIHSKDYMLYRLGTFDSKTGEVVADKIAHSTLFEYLHIFAQGDL